MIAQHTVPLLVWLTAAAWRRRSLACGLAAAAGAAVFSGFLSIPWPGHPARPELMLASDQYVLYGLAVLAGTAVALAREARQQETLLPTVGVYRRRARGLRDVARFRGDAARNCAGRECGRGDSNPHGVSTNRT